MNELVKELTNEVGQIPDTFPTPALSGSGYKGMFSAWLFMNESGTPLSEISGQR
jgi:hypothetical protein